MAGNPSQHELERLVLGALARHESYGYEIARSLAAQLRTSSEGTELSEGSVYPALRRLERSGLLCARWVEIGAGAPRRRYYVLSPKGERALARSHTEPRRSTVPGHLAARA
jgi:PadR family transcriptional regulator PadR